MNRKNISVSSGIVYEKFDRSNWLKAPKHSQVPRTSYFDARVLTIDTKSIAKHDKKRPTIQQMLAKM